MIDGEPAAFDLGFRYGSRFVLYLTAFDLAYRRFQVGHVNRYVACQKYPGLGISVYDFSKGSSQAKRLWMTESRSNFQYVFSASDSMSAGVNVALLTAISRAPIWAREHGINNHLRTLLGRLEERPQPISAGA